MIRGTTANPVGDKLLNHRQIHLGVRRFDERRGPAGHRAFEKTETAEQMVQAQDIDASTRPAR